MSMAKQHAPVGGAKNKQGKQSRRVAARQAIMWSWVAAARTAA